MSGRSGKSGEFGEVRKPDPGSFQARFGELVRNARTRKGLTQSDVARLAFNDEEAKSRVSDVERGRNEPNADTISSFCEALGIPYEDVEALRRSNSAAPLFPRGPLLHLDISAVPGFTGREDLLKSIDKALWEQGGTAAITQAAAVKGLGGVGKSVLAREYAWRARELYHGVWWVRAQDQQTLIDDLVDLGSRLIPNLKEVQERDRAPLALDAIAAAGADRPWLIVYDNVEKPSAIARLTPKTGAHVLITSRWPRWQGHAQELPVDVFPEKTAVDFLLAERPHETREAAGRLAAALGFLPLALSHARAYCAETNLSFDDYARRLSELIQEAPEDAEYAASVFATFSLAIAKAAKACPEAEKLMEIAAFLAPERIPLHIITEEVMDEKQREKAVAALFRVSLITHSPMDEGLRGICIHRMVQEVAIASQDSYRQLTSMVLATKGLTTYATLLKGRPGMLSGLQNNNVHMANIRLLAISRMPEEKHFFEEAIERSTYRDRQYEELNKRFALGLLRVHELMSSGRDAEARRCARLLLELSKQFYGLDHQATSNLRKVCEFYEQC